MIAVGSLARIQWALRKVRLPVAADGLVLDVGSGGCPYPRSDVLLERYIASSSSRHRCGQRLVVDRPLVVGDALAMPFKDKSFDFIVASHVLEHVPQPQAFLSELTRVGKAGYIETPNALFERLIPYDIHCLEILSLNGRLLIHKKRAPREDSFLGGANFLRLDGPWKALFWGAPSLFHVRHFWQDSIDFEIDNPQEECDWLRDDNGTDGDGLTEQYGGNGWRARGLRVLRKYYSLRKRRPIPWQQLLACPGCRGDLLVASGYYVCHRCCTAFPAEPHPNFMAPKRWERTGTEIPAHGDAAGASP